MRRIRFAFDYCNGGTNNNGEGLLRFLIISLDGIINEASLVNAIDYQKHNTIFEAYIIMMLYRGIE